MKKEVQIYITEVLSLLKELIPSANHNFTLGEDNRLWLWIMVNDKWQSIIFDENYEEITPAQLVEEIKNELIKSGYSI